MIYQFVFSIIIFILSLGYGVLVQKNLNIKTQNLGVLALFGLLTIGFMASLMAFVMPLNLYFEILVILLGIYLVILHFEIIYNSLKQIKLSPFFYIFLLLGLIFSAQIPQLYDHYSYYLASLKYLDELGLVKGLANFDVVLGQMSFWHILQASLNDALDIFNRLNFTLFVIFLIYSESSKEQRLYLFAPFFLFLLNSPSTDLPLFIIGLMMLNEILKAKKDLPDYLWILAILLYCIKPIGFVFLLILLSLKLYYHDFRIPQKIFLFGIFLLLLHFVKQFWVSSNPFFPIFFTNISGFDWSVPKEIYMLSKDYGRMIPLVENYTMQEVKNMNIWTYYQKVLFRLDYRSILHLFSFGVLISFCILSIIRKNTKIFIVSILFVIKYLIILTLSPQYRFNLDVMFYALFGSMLLLNFQFSKLKYGVMLSVLGLMSLIFWPKNEINFLPNNLFLNVDFEDSIIFPKVSEIQSNRLKDIDLDGENYGYVGPFWFRDFPVNTVSNMLLYDWLQAGYMGVPLDRNDLSKGYKSIHINEETRLKIEALLIE